MFYKFSSWPRWPRIKRINSKYHLKVRDILTIYHMYNYMFSFVGSSKFEITKMIKSLINRRMPTDELNSSDSNAATKCEIVHESVDMAEIWISGYGWYFLKNINTERIRM